jgi:RNA polymerase sigma-54 factor
MKPSLQLRIGQQLTMTPQLQQAIRLLQLSSLELQAEIQEALEANPLLESTEDDISADQEQSTDQTTADNTGANESTEKYDEDPHQSTVDIHDALSKEVVTKDLPVDTQWDDWDAAPPSSGTQNNADRDQNFEFQGSITESLQDHLLWQMQLTPFSERDMVIATAIIDSVSDDGYLNSSLDDIRISVGDNVMPDAETNDEELIAEHLLQQENEIIAVLRRIQRFDPLGVASRDLAECLLVQLAQFDDKTPEILDAEMIIK